jgi:hypothetical protein
VRKHEVGHSCAEVRQGRREDAIKHERARGWLGGGGGSFAKVGAEAVAGSQIAPATAVRLAEGCRKG